MNENEEVYELLVATFRSDGTVKIGYDGNFNKTLIPEALCQVAMSCGARDEHWETAKKRFEGMKLWDKAMREIEGTDD